MGKNYVKAVIKEPLFHFVLIGTFIFVLDAVLGNTNYIPSDNEILVTEALIESRVQQYSQSMGRKASDKEIISFINDYVHDEVYSREAKLLGLDKDDIVIKRRLVQKIKFMSADEVKYENPSEDSLLIFFQKQKENYYLPTSIDFYQVYLNTEQNTEEEIQTKAAELKIALKNISPESAGNKGDKSMLPAFFKGMTGNKLYYQLGNTELISQMDTLELDSWIGPISSSFGHHLVYVVNRSKNKVPEYAHVRKQIKEDYIRLKNTQAENLLFEQIKSRYIIKYDQALKSYVEER